MNPSTKAFRMPHVLSSLTPEINVRLVPLSSQIWATPWRNSGK